MIRHLHKAEFNGEFLSGMIAGYYEAYGADQSFLNFYGDENGGHLAIMDDTAVVCWHKHGWEELLLFLEAQGVSTVRTDPLSASYFEERWGSEPTVRPVMRCEKVVSSVETIVPLSPRKLYPFLANIFPEMPPFDDWYVDVCYRVRHGFCHISAIEWEDMPISSAMTVAEWKDGAVIGAVATAAEHRRKGYAARCVAALTSQLQQAGKTVYICPKNAAAQKVYEQLGFVVCGKTAMIERK